MLIHGRSVSPFWDYKDHLATPITGTAVYRLESVERGAKGFANYANPYFDKHKEGSIFLYDRLDEPSQCMFEENIAAIEGGEIAVTFASGMGAISGALGSMSKTGDHILSHEIIYGCTYSLLTHWYPKYKIEVEFRDLKNINNIKKWIKKNTRIIYFETPSNPNMELIDIEAVANIVHEVNRNRKSSDKIKIIVDNTFASPFCQRPLELGVDVVIHSLTKHIGGFGTDIGGVVITKKKYEADLMLYRKDFGANLSPKNVWNFLNYGLPTLFTRVRRAQFSAFNIAQYLDKHPLVDKVFYPGLSSFSYHDLAKKQMKDPEGNFAPGSLLYFALKGDSKLAKKRGTKLMNYLAKNSYCITLAVSLGHIKTLVEHPASMTHAMIPEAYQRKVGILPGGVRVSVGLENHEDIIRDLETGLKHCVK